MSKWRAGTYPEFLETRISPLEYRQLEKVAEILDTTRAQLMRFMVENAVWEKYGS